MAQYDDMNGMKATFRTLGCKLNYAETSYIEDKLRSIGVKTTDNGNVDICLVNTCSVTEMADHKCRQVIHKLVKDNPQAFVVVMGWTSWWAWKTKERYWNISQKALPANANRKAEHCTCRKAAQCATSRLLFPRVRAATGQDIF